MAFTAGDILGIIGVYGYVAIIVVLSWIFSEKLSNPRKTVHILTGGIVFFWWSFDTREVMAGLAAFPFVVILLLSTPRSPLKILRDSPLGARASEGHPYGLVLYAVSWTLIAYFLFDRLFAASIAILAMSFGDGMGELVGRKHGRHQYLHGRTVEGSMAVLCTTFVMVIMLDFFYFEVIGYSATSPPEMVPLFAAAIAGLVTCLEAVTPGKVDNLVIPLTIAGYLYLLGV